MTRQPIQPSIVAVCSLVVALTSNLSAQTLLRWRFEPGQQIVQTIQQDMKMTTPVGDQEVGTQVVQTLDAVWNVRAVDDLGVAEISQKFSRIRMKMEGIVGFEFDSREEQQPVGVGALLVPALRAMAESEFTMKITPLGEIQDVRMGQSTIDALNSIPAGAAASKLFSKERLITLIQQGAPKFPRDPVQPGASWTSAMQTEVPQAGTMEAESKFTYIGPERVQGVELERVDIELTTAMSANEAAGGLAKVDIKDQKSRGILYFDNAAGRLSHSSLLQKMTMQITVGQQVLEQKIDQTVKVRVSTLE